MNDILKRKQFYVSNMSPQWIAAFVAAGAVFVILVCVLAFRKCSKAVPKKEEVLRRVLGS